MIAKELNVGGKSALFPTPVEDSLMERLLPDELNDEQELEASLNYLKLDRTGSAHLTPLLTNRLVLGGFDDCESDIVLSHLHNCAWCPRMLREALQLCLVPADHPAFALLDQTDPWFTEAQNGLESLSDLAEDWDGHDAEPPNKTAFAGVRRVLELLRHLNFRPNRIAPSAEGGIMLSFFHGKRYGDIELFNTGEILAVTSDGSGAPTIWETTDNETEITNALEVIRDHVRAC